jgi:hypothetical protein
MKTNNNHKSDLTCLFSESLIAVLYGETDAPETEKFYSHLQSCNACSEELAAFGALRNSISDWRETEFSPLALPEIILPQERQTDVWVETGKTTWLDSLRGFFTPANLGWQMAGVSFAGLVILGFLLVYGLTDSKPPVEIVSAPKPSVTATPEIKTSPKPSPEVKAVDQENNPRRVAVTPAEDKPAAPVRASNKINKQPAGRTNSTDSLPKRQIPAQKRQQNLEEISILPTEAEDKSPRLTDLLDEVEPST